MMDLQVLHHMDIKTATSKELLLTFVKTDLIKILNDKTLRQQYGYQLDDFFDLTKYQKLDEKEQMKLLRFFKLINTAVKKQYGHSKGIRYPYRRKLKQTIIRKYPEYLPLVQMFQGKHLFKMFLTYRGSFQHVTHYQTHTMHDVIEQVADRVEKTREKLFIQHFDLSDMR